MKSTWGGRWNQREYERDWKSLFIYMYGAQRTTNSGKIHIIGLSYIICEICRQKSKLCTAEGMDM